MSETLDELKQAVAEISDDLKMHMSDVERALLVADRKELRQRISELFPGELNPGGPKGQYERY